MIYCKYYIPEAGSQYFLFIYLSKTIELPPGKPLLFFTLGPIENITAPNKMTTRGEFAMSSSVKNLQLLFLLSSIVS